MVTGRTANLSPARLVWKGSRKKNILRNHQMQIISIEVDITNYVFEHRFEFDVKKIVKELILREC